MNDIVAIYADGGLVIRNPSPYGGAWAWCGVDADGEIRETGSRLMKPEDFGMETISNNVTEFFALAKALRSMPNGWSGIAYSDSEVTLMRILGEYNGSKGLPDGWMEHARNNLKRLGKVEPVLLSGHPTKQELLNGVCRRRGRPVSQFNVWCDEECRRICTIRAKVCLAQHHSQNGRK